MHRSMILLSAYLNNRLQLFFHPKQVVNKGAHDIVSGETYFIQIEVGVTELSISRNLRYFIRKENNKYSVRFLSIFQIRFHTQKAIITPCPDVTKVI